MLRISKIDLFLRNIWLRNKIYRMPEEAKTAKPTIQVLTEVLTKMFMDESRPDHISLDFARLNSEELTWLNEFTERGFKLQTLLVALSRVPGIIYED